MTEQSEDRPLGRFPQIDINRLARPTWKLIVAEAFNLTPRLRRVRFTGDFAAMHWRPGQDLVLALPQPDGHIARRHYTIRAHDGANLDIDFVLHGDSPAANWARRARPGAAIEAQGPRGRTAIDAQAAHHIFVGDETSAPAIFAMAEALPARARATALIEIGDESDKLPLPTNADLALHWISREGNPPGPGALLLDRLKTMAPEPAGAHAYIIGETSSVRAQRHYLLERGFSRGQITAEGYWRPGRIGGHDHL